MAIDYIRDFFDFSGEPGSHKCLQVCGYFKLYCADFLEKYGINYNTADAIANSLLARMSDRRLHYHTPVHVLSMFQYAKENKIPLEKHEELAIWFHDAIYIPGAVEGQNEYESLAFMRSLLGSFIDNEELIKAGHIIKATAKHLEIDVDAACHKVMDLDLISFTFPNQQLITDCIWKEHSHLCMEEKFHQGRKAFLKKLSDKGFIYRSEPFLHLNATILDQIRKAAQ
jgi:predicted metal-dependent HD superfamily phosphohydrolase